MPISLSKSGKKGKKRGKSSVTKDFQFPGLPTSIDHPEETDVKYWSGKGSSRKMEIPFPTLNRDCCLHGDAKKPVDLVIPFRLKTSWEKQTLVEPKDYLHDIKTLVDRLNLLTEQRKTAGAPPLHPLNAIIQEPKMSADLKTGYILIHSPMEALLEAAEIEQAKLPAEKCFKLYDPEDLGGNCGRCLEDCTPDSIAREAMFVMTPAHVDKIDKNEPNEYCVKKEEMFAPAERTRLTWLRACRDETAMYFAFLGFLTKMLILPAVVGFVDVFVTGWTTLHHVAHYWCNSTKRMCPGCQKPYCRLHKMSDFCRDWQLTELIDNGTTMFLAVFMPMWMICFRRLWQRKEHLIKSVWGLTTPKPFELRERPCFHQAPGIRLKKNPVTGQISEILHFGHSFCRKLGSFFILYITILIVLANVLLLNYIHRHVYEAIAVENDGQVGDKVSFISSNIGASIVMCVIAIVLILLMEVIAEQIVELTVVIDNPKTEKDAQDLVAFRTYAILFAIFYSYVFYSAIFKSRWLHGIVYERPTISSCPPSGCMQEVFIYMCFVFGSFTLGRMTILLIVRTYQLKKAAEQKKLISRKTRWEEDDLLLEPTNLSTEYPSIFIQLGFVSLFTAVFPLAPLLGLIYAIGRIRIDAMDILGRRKRPVPSMVDGIGQLSSILTFLVYCTIATNGLLMALTSNFIEEQQWEKIAGGSSGNRMASGILSEADLSKWPHIATDKNNKNKTATCFYRDYRFEPTATSPYERNLLWWRMFGVRALFLIGFVLSLLLFSGLVKWLIPIVPKSVRVAEERAAFREKQGRAKTPLDAKAPPDGNAGEDHEYEQVGR